MNLRIAAALALTIPSSLSAQVAVPDLSAFDRFLKSTDDREISTTMAFVRILNTIIGNSADQAPPPLPPQG